MVKDNKNNRIEQFQQLIKLNNEAASDKEVHAHYRSLVEQGLELKIKCEYSDDDLEETGQINQFNELFFGGEKVSEWYCYWSYDHERDQQSEIWDVCPELDDDDCDFDVEGLLETLEIEVEEPDKSLWTKDMD